jgi:hypothetical protein
MCRPRRRPQKIDADYAAAAISKPELGFHATDPRFYTAGKESTLKLKIEGGKDKPREVVLANGNTEMRPIVIFTGPLIEPQISNQSITGKPFLKFVNPLFAGAWLYGNNYVAGETVEYEGKSFESLQSTVTIKALTVTEAVKVGATKAFLTKEVPVGYALQFQAEAEKHKVTKVVKVKAEEYEVEFVGGLKEEHLNNTEVNARPTPSVVAFWKEFAEKAKNTVKSGDQLVANLGIPHLIQYYKGGIGVGKPENVYQWLTSTSTWWDLIPGNNTIQFLTEDTEETGGTAKIEWSAAYTL